LDGERNPGGPAKNEKKSSKRSEREEVSAPARLPGWKPVRLLLVERSVADAGTVLRELASSRFLPEYVRVETAASLEKALKSETWDVILADCHIPGLAAARILELVRRRGRGAPLILLTREKEAEEFAGQALAKGARDYVRKQNLSRLVPAIERELLEAFRRRARPPEDGNPRERAAHFEGAADLERALEENQIAVHYQPVVDLATGEITGVEALARWDHPERGLLPPKEFIPLAEESGLILPLGRYILREACAQANSWHRSGRTGLKVSVNVSEVQLQDPSWKGEIESILAETGLAPEDLELEVPERAALRQVETTAETIRELKSLGVQIVIDGFGVESFSLSSLTRLALDGVKLDRSCVRELPESRGNAALARAAIVLAHELKLKIVAEGVETEEQRAFLRENRCDELQGFLYSRALPATEMTRLLESGSA
jgi:EAL domain-containing protein (putative c-di-GMP-specific phosphodiesterase class I)/CheY-like chemotaxis protein